MCLLLLPFTSAPAESSGIEDLELKLARVPPVSTSFIEYRFSHVLKRPTRISGTLEYHADGAMVRIVESPYQEHTAVSGGEVSIQRGQRAAQHFSLQRAPQLRVLLASFRALLDGHLTPLSQDFDLALAEDAPRWTLTLRPLDAKLQKYISHIEVYGADARPACLEAVEPDGDTTLTLFGGTDLPATPRIERAALEGLCRAGSVKSASTSP
jgi:hypothetical protein